MTPQELKTLRLSFNMTRLEFAARVGVTPDAVAKYEQGKMRIRKSVQMHIDALTKNTNL